MDVMMILDAKLIPVECWTGANGFILQTRRSMARRSLLSAILQCCVHKHTSRTIEVRWIVKR